MTVVGMRLGPNGLEPMVEGELSPSEELEVAVWRHQLELIAERFGDEAANKANIGSGTVELEEGVIVTSKVYGHGRLTTQSTKLGVFEDEWEDW